MLKSINAWAFDPQRPLPEVFQLAKEHGFDAVEVALAEDGPLTPHSTPDECAQIASQAQAAGVQLSGLASGLGWKYGLVNADAAVRQQAIEIVAASLRVAQALGVDALLVVPGGVGADFIPGFPRTSYETAYHNALASLEELKPVAQETGVALSVENVWNKFLLSPLEFRTFLDTVGSPQVGCYFDVGNVLITGYPEEWIGILGSRIKRVHFKDFKRSVGTIDGFCPLLEGDADYPAVMAALRAVGYDGPVAAEFFGCEDQLPSISQAMDRILEM